MTFPNGQMPSDDNSSTSDRTSPRIGKADLHIHTSLGDGLASVEQIFDFVQNYTDLDVIAITDHDDSRGALQALDLIERKNYRFKVIPGNEITTRNGHLLALFVTQEFPMLRPLDWTMQAVYEAGGIVIAPHPLSWLTTSIREKQLLAAHAGKYPFHGIETFNPSYAGQVAHKRVKELNRTVLNLPEFGGSDAHALSMIGRGFTFFPGHTIEDLMQAMRDKTTQAGGSFMDLRDHGRIAAPNLWKSMVVHPTFKVKRALNRRLNKP